LRRQCVAFTPDIFALSSPGLQAATFNLQSSNEMAASTTQLNSVKLLDGIMRTVHPEPQKRARTHEWIDQRSLALHRAIVQTLQARPELYERAKSTLERWIQQRQPSIPPVMLEWREILDHWPLEKVLELLTSADERPRRLRQSSPFCGILSPEERLAVFKEYESRGT